MENEKKIGEKFLFGRKRLHLVCIEKDGCKECFMKDRPYSECVRVMRHIGHCEVMLRKDGKNVVFKLID